MATNCKSEQTLTLTRDDLEMFKRMSVNQVGWAITSMMQICMEDSSSIYERSPLDKKFWKFIDGVLLRNAANNY